MKIIKYIVAFTLSVVVSLTSLSTKRNAKYNKNKIESGKFDSCWKFSLANFILRPEKVRTILNFYCKNANQEYELHRINMNDYIGNNNGKMVKGSGYSKSKKTMQRGIKVLDGCSDSYISNWPKVGVLTATCKDKNYRDVTSTINIWKLVWKADKENYNPKFVFPEANSFTH